MTKAVTLGISGLTIPCGTHFCAFFGRAQGLEEIVLPYLAEGIRAGNKCICVIESQLPSQKLSALTRHVDAGRSIETGQLQLPAPADTYLRSGRFSTDDMLNYWEQAALAARADGNSRFFRAAGEMPSVLDQPAGRAEFFRYEAKLSKLLSKHQQIIILCLYNLQHSGAQVLMDALCTHPVVLVDGLVHYNPFYVEPDEFLVCRDQQ